MTGLQVGGPWGALIGAGVGTIVGTAGAIAGNVKARKEANRLNTEGMLANHNFIKDFEHNTKNIATSNKNEALLNIAAEGGYMHTGDFTNGMTFFSEGGSHEQNPYQGV
jgi:outer membrane lipoprotein SlyB